MSKAVTIVMGVDCISIIRMTPQTFDSNISDYHWYSDASERRLRRAMQNRSAYRIAGTGQGVYYSLNAPLG